MLRKIQSYLEKSRDRGDAVLTTVLLTIPLLMICFAFATGVSMQLWQKQAYTTAAQSAVTNALQKTENTGYLGQRAMQEFVNQYLQQTGRCGVGMNCGVTIGGPANDQVQVGDDFGSSETSPFRCESAEIPGVGEKNLPYIELSLDYSRNSDGSAATYPYVMEGTSGVISPPAHGRIAPGEEYRVLTAVVYEASSNVTAFGFSTPFESANPGNCQAIGTTVSAVLFGNQEDLSPSQSCPQPDMFPVSPGLVQQVNTTPTVVKTSPLNICTTVVGNLPKYSIVTVLGTYRTWSYVQLPDASYGWVQTDHLEDVDGWTISIDYDGGTPGSPANPATYDWSESTTPITLTEPSRANYGFGGFQQIDCSAPYGNIGVAMRPTTINFGLYGNLCFKATWEVNNYTVTWDRNGGTGGAGGNTVTYAYGSPITVPGAPTWTGRIFDGWFTAPTGGSQITNSPSTLMPGNNVTYYAHWHNSPYSISYNFAGGTASPAGATSYTFSTAQQDVSLGGAARACYTFGAWSVSNGSVVSGNTLRIPANTTGAITATASWTANSNSITYNANGGSGVISSTTSYTVSAGAQTVALTRPTRAGYTFSSWSVTGAGASITGNTLTIPANGCGSVAVTANWVINSYTVSFKRWDGTAISTQTVSHGSACNWPSTTLSGYTFWTWGTGSGANNTGTTLSACPTVTANVTYYAHYTRVVSQALNYNATFSWSKWCATNTACNAYVSWSWSCPSGGSYSGGQVQFYDNYANAYRTAWRYEQSNSSFYVASTNNISRVSASASGGKCTGTQNVTQYY